MRDNPNWYDKNDPNFCSPFANDPEILIENYSFYIEKTPKLNEWCDINHMLALSAVLMIPIKSYHPSVGGVSNPFCRLIVGRGVPEDEGVDTKLSIMWTSTIFPEKMEDFRPNHFVPLIPHKVKSKDFHQGMYHFDFVIIVSHVSYVHYYVNLVVDIFSILELPRSDAIVKEISSNASESPFEAGDVQVTDIDDEKKQYMSSNGSSPSIRKADNLKSSQGLGGKRFNMDGVFKKIKKVKTSIKTLVNRIFSKGIF